MNRANELRCFVLAPALALCTSLGIAQDGLGAQLVAAATANDWSRELEKLFTRHSIGQLVDALGPVKHELGEYLPRVADRLAKNEGVLALWNDEPDRRRARATVFAELRCPWVSMHHAAAAAERADIEEVARHALPTQFLASLRAGSLELRASAATLMRIAVQGERARPNPWAANLRRTDCSDREVYEALDGSYSRFSAFVLDGVLTDPDLRVRAKAVLVLRQMLGQAMNTPPRVVAVLESDPDPRIRAAARHRPGQGPTPIAMTDRDLEELIAGLVAGTEEPPASAMLDPGALAPAARARLFKARIDCALRAPLDEPVVPDPGFVRPKLRESPAFARAKRCFAAAAMLGDEQYLLVLAMAINATDVQITQRVLAALAQVDDVPARARSAAAPLLAALIDHADATVSVQAAMLAERMLAERGDAALRDKVTAMALAILANQDSPLWVDDPPRRLGPAPGPRTRNRSAQIVRAAAAAGDARLVAPLLAALEKAGTGGGPGGGVPHRTFLLQCLALLAPVATTDQAQTLHGLLCEEVLDPRQPPNSGIRGAAADVVYGLYAVVPAHLVPWYDALLAQPAHVHGLSRRVAQCVDRIAEYRLRRLLRATDLRKAKSPSLYLRAPDLLVTAWWAGGEWRDAAADVVSVAARTDLDRVVKLLESGKLPREIAAAGCGDAKHGLGTLARLLPAGGAEAAAWAPAMVRAIAEAPPTTPEEDLRALRVLAASPVNDVGYAVARRAVLLGPPARELSRALLARQSVDPDLRTATAGLRIAVEHGIALPGLPALLTRLRAVTEWDARVVADAAELRFGALDPSTCKYPGESIAMAGIDVDVEGLRKALGAQAAWRLMRLLPQCSPTTGVNGLRLAGELPFWDETLEAVVLGKTGDADPRVRRAAYEALHTRDAGLWPCAWLVHEAVFDPDPLVRAFAQQLGR